MTGCGRTDDDGGGMFTWKPQNQDIQKIPQSSGSVTTAGLDVVVFLWGEQQQARSKGDSQYRLQGGLDRGGRAVILTGTEDAMTATGPKSRDDRDGRSVVVDAHEKMNGIQVT